jgi:hypothetical protein
MRRAAIGAAVLAAGLAAGAAWAAPAHYIVFERDGEGTVEAVFAREVELAELPRTKSEAELEQAISHARRDGVAIALRVVAPSGAVVHRDVVEVVPWIRGEFHGGEGMIDGHLFRAERVPFVVRVPRVDGGLLTLDGAARGTFEPARLVEETMVRAALEPPAALPRAATLGAEGPSANRMDLLIMGDGYTAAQEATFLSHASSLATSFFSLAPYSVYRPFHNVHSLFTPSSQQGADHPPYNPSCPGSLSCCSTPLPLAGTYVNTAFDARFCASNIPQLLVVNGSKVLAAASAVPDWDKILVLVHDNTYGGSGGFLSVTSREASSIEIARHEYNHSFTGLADEYENPYAYPPCSDLGGGPPCEPNVTDQQSPALIKWEPWIAPTTPVPTPETSQYASVVGLFEGARYRQTGMFRPRYNSCLMRNLGQPLDQVCQQEYVLMLYRGGWGEPASGIDPIEPGGESPPPGPVTTAGPLELAVDLIYPVGHGTTLETRWYVDGVLQPTPTPPDSFTFLPPAPGTYEVRVLVRDPTAMVHPEMEDGELESDRVWTVQVTSAAPPGETSALTVDRAAGGQLRVSWGASCSAASTGYGVHEGDLGAWYSHTAIDCADDDATPLAETITPRTGNSYYLVVPHHAGAEGSYGTATGGVERPVGQARCAPAQQTGC